MRVMRNRREELYDYEDDAVDGRRVMVDGAHWGFGGLWVPGHISGLFFGSFGHLLGSIAYITILAWI
jgi:hypothetical protein